MKNNILVKVNGKAQGVGIPAFDQENRLYIGGIATSIRLPNAYHVKQSGRVVNISFGNAALIADVVGKV